MQEGIFATFKTDKGNIKVQLTYDKTPGTVGNFVGLVKGLIENDFKVYPVDKFVKTNDIKFYEFEEVEDLTNNILIATYHDYFKKLNLSNKKVVP